MSTLLTTASFPAAQQAPAQQPQQAFAPQAPAQQPRQAFAPQAPAQQPQQVPAWTNEAFDDANARHEFIAVGIPNRNRVTIQDAYEIWAANPAVLFQTGYRIAGTLEDITAALQAVQSVNEQGEQIAQFSDEQIAEVLATAISNENYTGDMSADFHREMSDYITWNRTAVRTNVTAPGNTMYNTMTSLNPGLLANTQAKPRAVATGGPGRKVETISQKLQKATYDKPYLDVSTMDEYGRKTKWIGPGSLAGRVGTPRIPIVSNKLDRYIAAINMIPNGAQIYAEDIAEVARLLGGSATATTFPHAGQQVLGAMAGPPGTQPFYPQRPTGVTPVPVAAIRTAKQRKQQLAATATQLPSLHNFTTTAAQPMGFPGQIAGQPVNFIGLDDDEYDDEDEEDGYYDNVAPVNFITQGFAQQPQQQYAPAPQQQQYAPAPQQQQYAPAPQQQQYAPAPQQQFAPAPRPGGQFPQYAPAPAAARSPMAPQQQFAPAPRPAPAPVGQFPQYAPAPINFNRPPTAPQQQYAPAPINFNRPPTAPQASFPQAPRPIAPVVQAPRPVTPVAPVAVTPAPVQQEQPQAEAPLM